MQNWLQLENKVIIVTGGETGIGKAIADKLSGLSANVISADIHTDSANKQDRYLSYLLRCKQQRKCRRYGTKGHCPIR